MEVGVHRIRKSQRAPKRCIPCANAKIKCDKNIPCSNCTRKNVAQFCYREPVVVRNVLHNVNNCPPLGYDELVKENKELKTRILELESKHKLARPYEPTEYNHSNLPSIRFITRNIHSDKTNTRFGSLLQQEQENISYYCNQKQCIDLLESDFFTYYNVLQIVEFNLSNISFIHCAVIPFVFMEQLQTLPFDIQDFEAYAGDSLKNLWASKLFGLLASGLHLANEALLAGLGIGSKKANDYARIFFILAVEALHRGNFLEQPSIAAIEAYCAFNMCFHDFVGSHLQNVMVNITICTARALGLDQLDASANGNDETIELEHKKRLWLILLITDWLDCYGRVSLINPGSFKTPLPLNMDEETLCVYKDSTFVSITYQRLMFQIAQNKRSWYYNDMVQTVSISLDTLVEAEKALLELQESLDKIVSIKRHSGSAQSQELNPNFSSQKILLYTAINMELLDINRMTLLFIPREEWIRNRRDHCIRLARNLISFICGMTFLRVFWIFSEALVVCSTFLLLDITLVPGEDDQRLQSVLSARDALTSLCETHLGARRGLAVVDHLLSLVKKPISPRYDSSPDDVPNIEHYFNGNELKDLFNVIPEGLFKGDSG
ncbi:BA75_01857T0 [Komagataella pastoris]|uniref:BA75_01857T0 n=1 Tax=Komagataella pastoris TaxID=4922 RepID=A0A1B2J7M0_PICPA|nr:BA75_01857T0 [Komagataella pastoris]